jgi:hypothetical protein
MRFSLQRLCAHLIRFALQALVVIDVYPLPELQGGPHTALLLLYHMPGFMRQVPLLPWGNVDVGPLRVGQCVELRGLG